VSKTIGSRIIVPEAFATSITREGEAGRQWIAELPDLVEKFCEQWGLVIDGAPMHGALGLAVPVQRGDEPAVLKISWSDESTLDEAAALAAWQGRGAVRLLEMQPELNALLLERLDFSRSLNDVGIEEAVTVAGRLLRRLAIPAPLGLRTTALMAEKMMQIMPERWERYGRPMPRPLLDQACDLAQQLGQTNGSLLVNYDLIYEDVLASQREPWLAVDPKVAVGDLEFGLAQLLWCRLEDMQAQNGLAAYFRLLIETAELDEELTRAWTFVRCVDYWLWGLSAGLTYDPARCEVIVNWLAGV